MSLFGFDLRVEGLRATTVALHLTEVNLTQRAAVGLTVGGRAVRDEAKSNMQRYRFHGRAQRGTTVGRPFFSPIGVDVTVGLHRGANAPEGRVFEFLWHPHKGKGPPIDAIVAWLVTKPSIIDSKNLFVTKRSAKGRVRPGHTRATISAEPGVRRQAFAISRAILKRPGLAVGEVRWLDDAAKAKQLEVVAAVAAALTI